MATGARLRPVATDERLMERYQAGEATAFVVLYRRQVKRLARFFERRGAVAVEGAQQPWFQAVCARALAFFLPARR
jgi:hypothetical protein